MLRVLAFSVVTAVASAAGPAAVTTVTETTTNSETTTQTSTQTNTVSGAGAPGAWNVEVVGVHVLKTGANANYQGDAFQNNDLVLQNNALVPGAILDVIKTGANANYQGDVFQNNNLALQNSALVPGAIPSTFSSNFQGGASQGPHPALMFGIGAATVLSLVLAVPFVKKQFVAPAEVAEGEALMA